MRHLPPIAAVVLERLEVMPVQMRIADFQKGITDFDKRRKSLFDDLFEFIAACGRTGAVGHFETPSSCDSRKRKNPDFCIYLTPRSRPLIQLFPASSGDTPGVSGCAEAEFLGQHPFGEGLGSNQGSVLRFRAV